MHTERLHRPSDYCTRSVCWRAGPKKECIGPKFKMFGPCTVLCCWGPWVTWVTLEYRQKLTVAYYTCAARRKNAVVQCEKVRVQFPQSTNSERPANKLAKLCRKAQNSIQRPKARQPSSKAISKAESPSEAR